MQSKALPVSKHNLQVASSSHSRSRSTNDAKKDGMIVIGADQRHARSASSSIQSFTKNSRPTTPQRSESTSNGQVLKKIPVAQLQTIQNSLQRNGTTSKR